MLRSRLRPSLFLESGSVEGMHLAGAPAPAGALALALAFEFEAELNVTFEELEPESERLTVK